DSRSPAARPGRRCAAPAWTRTVISTAVAFLCSASPGKPQEPAFLHGRVADAQGAPIYGALVAAESAAGNRHTTVTDDRGLFQLSSLPLENYNVKISASAFADWTASNLPASPTLESEPLLAVLQVAPQLTAVRVSVPPDEVAAEQLRSQLKQRTLVVIP